MADLDLVPPTMPGTEQKKRGFFGRLFHKEPPAPAPVVAPPPTTDLDDIKRKLGLDEDLPAPQTQPAPLGTVAPVNAVTPLDTLPSIAAPSPAAITAQPLALNTPNTEQEKEEIDHIKFKDLAAELKEEKNVSVKGEERITMGPWATATPVSEPAPSAWTEESGVAKDPNRTPVYHPIIDKHLAELDQAHQKIIEKIQKVSTDLPSLPEWHVQDEEVKPEQYFILRNGQQIKSLQELIDAVEYIDDSTFDHHVNEYRNDFANWIRDVIQDNELAQRVSQATVRTEMLRELNAHRREAARDVVQQHQKLADTIKKRKDTVKTLGSVEQKISDLQDQLAKKSRELQEERSKAAKALKEKIDQEVEQRLASTNAALERERKDLADTKQLYLNKAKDYDDMLKNVIAREQMIGDREAQAKAAQAAAQEEQQRLAQVREESQKVVREAEAINRQLTDIKTVSEQTRVQLDNIKSREGDLNRREETLRQRESKLTADLTRIKAEEERITSLNAALMVRETATKELERDAKKMLADAETRTNDALAIERDSRTRIKQDLDKLEDLRHDIDKALAKALGEKKKLANAIALRKYLEQQLHIVRDEVVKERKQMEEEAFKSYIEVKDKTTVAGQPGEQFFDDSDAAKKNPVLYRKIQQCRVALERNDLTAARQLYTELRDEYSKVQGESAEKSAMYMAIRELYDDIHLAMLN